MSINSLLDDLRRWFGSPDAEGPGNLARDPSSTGRSGRTRCFVVDDEAGIRRFIVGALKGRDLDIEEFSNAQDLLAAVTARPPQIIFLDVSLENSDAVEALRGLARLAYRGVTQLMSGRDSALLDDVRLIGERHALNMLPTLQKPFRVEDVRRIAQHFASSRTPKSIALDEALDRGWMRVWYQPKIDLQKNRLVGIEALARVEHPDYGIMLPGTFLPGASDGSLGRLTELVLTSTLHDWTALAEAGFPLTPAVNVPANVLFAMPLAALAREHWPKANTAHGLIFEVTEDQIVRDIEAAHEVATQLKIYDISLSIDDFGAGYSSFAQLKSLPFCELKLDRSFVKDCASNADNGAICQMAIDLAHRFGSKAVAEGIESPEDLRALHQMGCDVGQGFLLAMPMPLDRLLTSLRERQPQDSKVIQFPSGRTGQKAAQA